MDLKANIPTHELKLENGAVVVLYDYITTGESRQLQKILLEKGKYNSTTNQIEDLPLGVFLESQDQAASFLIKAVVIDGASQPFSIEWLSALPQKEGNAVYDEVNKLTNLSQLTQDQKKG